MFIKVHNVFNIPQYSWVQNSYSHRQIVYTMINDGSRVFF